MVCRPVMPPNGIQTHNPSTCPSHGSHKTAGALTHLPCSIAIVVQLSIQVILSQCFAIYTESIEVIISFSDSDYSIAFNLAKTDETFQHARDPMVQEPITYLHDMESYRTMGKDFDGVFEELGPSDKFLSYPGNCSSIL